MYTDRPEPTKYQLEVADRLDQQAKDCLRREEESFDRCDTDGFLSQWANSISATEYRKQAEILRNGGYSRFLVLVDTTTNKVVSTELVTFPHPKFSWQTVTKWKITDQDCEDRTGRRWIPYGEKSRIQKQHGLREDYYWFPAWAKIGVPVGSKSTGLGGCANARVMTYKIKSPMYLNKKELAHVA